MLRPFRDDDLPRCEAIVNSVWDFDHKIPPKPLARFFRHVYTAGSLAGSTFAAVVELDGVVAGFLFGSCGDGKPRSKEYYGVAGGLKILFQLLTLRGVALRRKRHFLKILSIHAAKRAEVEPDRTHEIQLFAVDPGQHGRGFGRLLLDAFTEHCAGNKIRRITVETDYESNYGFYEHMGFTKVGEFDSPLQLEYSGKSGITMVYEKKLSTG